MMLQLINLIYIAAASPELALVSLVAGSSQILYRSYFKPITERLSKASWKACVTPGETN